MTTDSYKQALRTAEYERESLLQERAKIDEKLEKLGAIIDSLRPLCNDEESEIEVMKMQAALAEYGLADACRFVLTNTDRFMTPIAIRNVLEKEGYDLSGQTNALASIHSIAKRLVQSGEAIEQQVEGKTFYKWNTSGFKHSPLKNIGQRMTRVPTGEDAEAWAENSRRRAEAQAEMERAKKAKLPKVPDDPRFSVANAERTEKQRRYRVSPRDTPKHPAYGETITEPPPVAPGAFQRRFAQGLKKETDKKKD